MTGFLRRPPRLIGWRATLFAGAVLGAGLGTVEAISASPVGVPDLIALSRYGSYLIGGTTESAEDATPLFSPDGTHFSIVMQKGILARNSRQFSLLVFRANPEGPPAIPRVAVEFEHSGEGPAISQVAWLSDDTLVFRGERAGEVPQVFAADLTSGKIRQQTHATEKITVFKSAPHGNFTIYVTEGPTQAPTDFSALKAHGFAIPASAELPDILEGKWARVLSADRGSNVMHVARGGQETTFSLKEGALGWNSMHGAFASRTLSVNPAGNLALFLYTFTATPDDWHEYKEAWGERWAKQRPRRWWIVADLRSGELHPLTGAPWWGTSLVPPVWTADGQSVIVVNNLVGLEGTSGAERKRRAGALVTAEVNARSGMTTIIAARDDLDFAHWDAASATLDLQPKGGEQESKAPLLRYRKTGPQWSESPDVAAPPCDLSLRFEIQEGPNEPWKIVRVDPRNKTRMVFYDPNSAFLSQKRLAKVTLRAWTTPSGAKLEAGLYEALGNGVAARRPVVIQTHGFSPSTFAPDGYAITGFAAQPLAAAGVTVVQAYRVVSPTPQWAKLTEGQRIQEAWESLIDSLDRSGSIDRTRVGLQGYSRSCYHILYFLTHSAYPIAAASCADGVDYGYFQALAFSPGSPILAQGYAGMNDGWPYGAGWATWRTRSPGFNLDRIRTPLQLVALGSAYQSAAAAILAEWEPFAGLSLLKKPVELLYLPNAPHNVVQPWDRFASQQGTVDWFRFWLQEYERGQAVVEAEETPETLRAQYNRWHVLRDLRDAKPSSETRR